MNLNEMLLSDEYMTWHSDMMNRLTIDSPARSGRCLDASEHGADGSLHVEIMNDWLYFLEFHSQDMEVSDIDYHKIHIEILECWDWHDKNGSLYDEVG